MSEPVAVHIETFGCQMNKLDSELVMSALTAEGFTPAASRTAADVVLFNTCSVREHAERRVYSRLADLKRRAAREPNLVIGVIGCMAQKDAERVFERCPWVSVVCGPTHLDRLPALIRQALAGYRRVQAVSADIRQPGPTWDPPRPGASLARPGGHSRFVRIMRGCDNFCAYCIVPFVRGPEVSRPVGAIVEEVRGLAGAGCREVTLLGQNVNSYRHDDARLPHLLERLNAIDGLLRIRFVTSHPKDLTDDILDAMAGLEKVCEHLHLPAQAGADSELARMNRGYARAQYLGIVERARQRMPAIGLMSDFIVGFPGETEAEFEATRGLIEEVHYKNCFIFHYSPRPGTAAARMTDDVPLETKQARLADLLAVQRRIAEVDNRTFIGRDVEVLVEGPSKRARRRRSPLPPPVEEGQGQGEDGGINRDQSVHRVPAPDSRLPITQLVGRTRSDHIVVFDGSPHLAGSLVTVRIAAATDLTLFGAL